MIVRTLPPRDTITGRFVQIQSLRTKAPFHALKRAELRIRIGTCHGASRTASLILFRVGARLRLRRSWRSATDCTLDGAGTHHNPQDRFSVRFTTVVRPGRTAVSGIAHNRTTQGLTLCRRQRGRWGVTIWWLDVDGTRHSIGLTDTITSPSCKKARRSTWTRRWRRSGSWRGWRVVRIVRIVVVRRPIGVVTRIVSRVESWSIVALSSIIITAVVIGRPKSAGTSNTVVTGSQASLFSTLFGIGNSFPSKNTEWRHCQTNEDEILHDVVWVLEPQLLSTVYRGMFLLSPFFCDIPLKRCE